MNRLPQIDPASATGKTKQLLDVVKSNFGVIPNLARVLANAPAALEGFLGLSGALAGGSLSAKVRQKIAIAVAQGNHCDYCLSANSFIAEKLGVAQQDIADARHGISAVDKDDAILKLALSILVQQGQVSDAALKNARAAGLSDAEIVETTANVALSIFTNYVSHVAHTVVDFPELKSADVQPAEACASGCGCEH